MSNALDKVTNTNYTITINQVTLIACIIGLIVLVFLVKSCKEDVTLPPVDTTNVQPYLNKIKQQDSLIQIYQNNIVLLSTKQEQLTNKLIQTRKEYEIKIQNIKRYTPTQLDSFFANRYNKLK
jgi:Na+/melibiose symporter-like transporter